MSSAKFTLFSLYYKRFSIPQVPYVKPIHAGHALYDDLGIEGDDSGDHISARNPNWVELTAAYYIWKNYSKEQIPYWGLCHYRRYLTLPLGLHPFKRIYYLKATVQTYDRVLNDKLAVRIEQLLSAGKIILPRPYYMYKLKKWSVKQQYIKDHDAIAWDLMEAAVKKLYPEYSDTFHAFAKGLTLCLYNIMIASWEFWDGYLNWVFNILHEVEKDYIIPGDPNQRRVFAFLSERLLNVYVRHHQKYHGQKIAYLPIAHLS
jgi:hypothetical protein